MRIVAKTLPLLAALSLAQPLVLSLPAQADETARQISMTVIEHVPATQTGINIATTNAAVNLTAHATPVKPGVVEQYSGANVSSRPVSKEAVQQYQGSKLVVGIEKHSTVVVPGQG